MIKSSDSVLENSNSLKLLREKYPFPATNGIEEFYFSVDGGGREILVELIQQQSIELMIEIGCFLCGSSIQWLQANEALTVIGVDPWNFKFAKLLDRWNGDPVFDPCFQTISNRAGFIESVREHGGYLSALANVRRYQDRFVPVKARSPQILYELYELGVKPQLLYFDSDKVLDDLEVSLQLFPDAVLAGDDWLWGKEQEYPVQKAVTEFCQRNAMSVTADRSTWILQK